MQTWRAWSGHHFLLFFLFPFKSDREGAQRLSRQRLAPLFPPLRWCLSCICTRVYVYFSTGGDQLSSQLDDVWSALSSGCLQNIRGWKPSFLSGLLLLVCLLPRANTALQTADTRNTHLWINNQLVPDSAWWSNTGQEKIRLCFLFLKGKFQC